MLEFTREQELLSKWRAFVEEVDPDVIIGYNTSQFDIPYLMDRAKALKVTDFPFFSRLKGACRELGLLPSPHPLPKLTTLNACRIQDRGEGDPLFFEGVRHSRLEGDGHGRTAAARHSASHAA